MILEVTLAGHTDLWACPGSFGLAAWFGALPWAQSGGAVVVQSAPERGATTVIDALTRAVFSAQGDRGNLRVVKLSEVDSRAAPLQVLGREICQLPTGKYDARKVFGGALQDAYVFVLTALDPVPMTWWDDLCELVEWAAKTSWSGPLACVMVDEAGRFAAEPAHDFRSGQPTSQLFALQLGSPITLWQAYAHRRIAWEVGGNLELAYRLDEMATGVPVGDEIGLESVLNQFAEDMARVSKEALERLLRFLGSSPRSGNSTAAYALDVDDRREMELASLLWPAEGRRTPRLTPWTARAIAKTAEGYYHREQLRAALVCAPLATELLRVCFELETRIRADRLSDMTTETPSLETKRNFERFCRGGDDFVRYPAGHPAIPSEDADVWAFASLVEVLKATRERSPAAIPDSYESARLLRNTVAHGHYVCWHHIQRASSLIRSIN